MNDIERTEFELITEFSKALTTDEKDACMRRLATRHAAADALAVAGEKAENAFEAFLNRNDVSTRGTARAALRELSAALRQYQETR